LRRERVANLSPPAETHKDFACEAFGRSHAPHPAQVSLQEMFDTYYAGFLMRWPKSKVLRSYERERVAQSMAATAFRLVELSRDISLKTLPRMTLPPLVSQSLRSLRPGDEDVADHDLFGQLIEMLAASAHFPGEQIGSEDTADDTSQLREAVWRNAVTYCYHLLWELERRTSMSGVPLNLARADVRDEYLQVVLETIQARAADRYLSCTSEHFLGREVGAVAVFPIELMLACLTFLDPEFRCSREKQGYRRVVCLAYKIVREVQAAVAQGPTWLAQAAAETILSEGDREDFFGVLETSVGATLLGSDWGLAHLLAILQERDAGQLNRLAAALKRAAHVKKGPVPRVPDRRDAERVAKWLPIIQTELRKLRYLYQGLPADEYEEQVRRVVRSIIPSLMSADASALVQRVCRPRLTLARMTDILLSKTLHISLRQARLARLKVQKNSPGDGE
jgi:hypothetical protein